MKISSQSVDLVFETPSRIKRHNKLALFVFLLSMAPLAELGKLYLTTQINQVDLLLNRTGHWTIVFLLIAMGITPARALGCRAARLLKLPTGKRLSDWNWLIRLRRMFGLWCFFYSLLHLLVYFFLDQLCEWQWVLEDIINRQFVLAGAISSCLLVPLAATSSDRAMRTLGKNWKHLQRLIYPIGVIAVVHVYLAQKVMESGHEIYLLTLAIIIFCRIFTKWFNRSYRHDDGDLVKPRKPEVS